MTKSAKHDKLKEISQNENRIYLTINIKQFQEATDYPAILCKNDDGPLKILNIVTKELGMSQEFKDVFFK